MARFARLLGCLCGSAVLSTAALASADFVRGIGRVAYFENGGAGGARLPLVGVRVSLMDDDDIFDDTIAVGYSDASGNFNLSGNAEDGIFGGRPDPYIEIELESRDNRLVVESDIVKLNVTCATPSRNSTIGTINFGEIVCAGGARDASTIFARLKRSYEMFQSLSGDAQVPRHNGKAAVLFPAFLSAGVPYTTDESIRWPADYRRFDAIPHEFGHRIRHAQDGDFGHFLGDVVAYSYMQHHSPDKVTNPGFAFNEGWADYNAAVNNTTRYDNWTPRPGGESVEGNVSANLWKLHANCGGFAKLWSVLKSGGGSIHSWAQYSGRFLASVQNDGVFRGQNPRCMPTLTGEPPPSPNAQAGAASGTKSRPRVDFTVPTQVNGTNLATAPLAQPNSGFTAADLGVPVINQQAVMMALGANAKAAAKNRKFRQPFPDMPGLKDSSEKLVQNRQQFENAEADKLAAYTAKLTPIEATKDALEKRSAEHAAFVKEVLNDSLALLESQLQELYSRRKTTSSKGGKNDKEEAVLDKAISRLEATRNELREAAKLGKMTRKFLPRSFKGAAEMLQSSKP
jgi:hypothetical protein